MKKMLLLLSFLTLSAQADSFLLELDSKELGLVKAQVELNINAEALQTKAQSELRIIRDNGQIQGYWCETSAQFKKFLVGELKINKQSFPLHYSAILSTSVDIDESVQTCELEMFPLSTMAYLVSTHGVLEVPVKLTSGETGYLHINLELNRNQSLVSTFTQVGEKTTLKPKELNLETNKINFYLVKKSDRGVSFLEHGAGRLLKK